MILLSFLYSVISAGDSITLFKVNDKFVQPKERPYLEFVKDFFAKYNKLPDYDTIEQKFNIELLDNTESPDYWYNEILEKYQDWVIEQAVINSAKDKKKALGYFQEAIIEHNVDIDSKILDYSDAKRRIQDYNKRKGTNGITYLSTGEANLDNFSLGYKRADLWTIGGREGLGKTWYLLRMAEWIDQHLIDKGIKKNILFVSGEMDAQEIEERLDAIRCELSYARLSKGELKSGEERKYKRYLQGFDSNIKIVDSFDNLKDIEYFQTIYRPAITFIDGSHLLATSYDWTEIAKVTSDMKRMTRNKKIPIINTTHLKAERGRDASGGDIDDFAYSKGYTRDSDIVGVMYASDMMEVENKVGIDWVKVRRGARSQLIWQNDYETCKTEMVESKVGSQIASAKTKSGTGNSTQGRNGKQGSDLY